MSHPYSPPLASVGLLASGTTRTRHAYPNERKASLCGIEPGWRQWHSVYVVTRPVFEGTGLHGRICRSALLEQTVVRSFGRLGGQGRLDAIVADIPGTCKSRQVERVLLELIGRNEVQVEILVHRKGGGKIGSAFGGPPGPPLEGLSAK